MTVQTCAHCHRSATTKRWSIAFGAWYCINTEECVKFKKSMDALEPRTEEPTSLLWNGE